MNQPDNRLRPGDQTCVATAARSVLIADDDWDLADALAIRLRSLGLKVTIVHGAEATMHALQNETPDLLILDVHKPDGNALKICETMALDADLARIRVLILTGRTDPATIEHCRLFGAYYLFKTPDVWRRIEPLVSRLLLDPRPAQ